MSRPEENARFATTRWSLVLAAAKGDSGGAEALAALCRAYWRPIYHYVRHRGFSRDDAQDLTQGFFTRLLEKESLRRADPERGRFRSFLLAAVRNFLANEWDRRKSLKRGGDTRFLTLDELDSFEAQYGTASPRPEWTPESLYERTWALTLLDRATERMAAEFQAAGKAHLFETLKTFMIGDGDVRYSQASKTLEMSEGTLRVAVHRMRVRFRELVRAEIRETLPNPDDPEAVQAEIRHLLSTV